MSYAAAEIVFDHVTKRYAGRDASSGRRVAARGTALKMVNRLIPFDSGEIRIDGRSIVDLPIVAAIAGGGGLGDIIVNQASYRLSGVIGASICVMALSAGLFVALLGIQIGVTPRPLRRTSVIVDVPRKE